MTFIINIDDIDYFITPKMFDENLFVRRLEDDQIDNIVAYNDGELIKQIRDYQFTKRRTDKNGF